MRNCSNRSLASLAPLMACALGAPAVGALAAGCAADSGMGMPTDDMGDPGGTPDLGSGYPAPFPTPPQVVKSQGPVLVAPRAVPVFFANSMTYKDQIVDFTKRLGSTEYWRATTEEYGVGPMTATAPVLLAESPTGTISTQAVETWLKNKLETSDPAFPEPDENTVYVLHYPVEVTIQQQGFFGLRSSCTSFGGYHGDVVLGWGLDVAYAVIPECPTFGALMGLDALTGPISHELIEAATDPFPTNDPAWFTTDTDHLYWAFALGGGENADLCAQDPASFTRFPELKYVVQRSWSNKAALAGNDPCVPPIAGQVYFNTAPELTEPVTLGGGGGQSYTMLGVSIPVGQSKTVPLRLYSEAPTAGDWRVSARDVTAFSGGISSLSFTFDKTTGHNGDTLNLTIKSTRQAQFGATVFMLTSKLGTQQHTYFGLVGQ